MLLFLQRRFLQLMLNGLRIICENDVNSDQSEVPYNMKKAITKSFSEHKTAKILLIVSAFLWAVFVMVRLLLPKGTFLIGQADGWLFAAVMLLSWISCGFWLAILIRQCHWGVKMASWFAYSFATIGWLFLFYVVGYVKLGVLPDWYVKAQNNKQYAIRGYFDCSFYTMSLYHKEGLLERPVCFLDYYYDVEDLTLSVFEDHDSVVVKCKDLSTQTKRTDIYHFDGSLYENIILDE